MIRPLADGYELDDDFGRVDLAAVDRFLSEESSWEQGRRRETVERWSARPGASSGSTATGARSASPRAVTDGLSFVYLADVYVRPECRGRRLGVELVRELVERGTYAGLKWMLHTADAHRLYERLGFGRPGEKVTERLP